MPYYRIYGLDAEGRIASVVEAEHEDDARAMQHAHRSSTSMAPMWGRARRAGHVAPAHEDA